MLEHLTDADFVLEANRSICRAAVELYRREEPVDPVSIRAEARGAVSDAYMMELMQATNTAANAGIYAEETRRASMRRSLVALGQELEQRAASMGAHAVVGVDMDYEVLGQGNMLMVTASGTAVTLEQA